MAPRVASPVLPNEALESRTPDVRGPLSPLNRCPPLLIQQTLKKFSAASIDPNPSPLKSGRRHLRTQSPPIRSRQLLMDCRAAVKQVQVRRRNHRSSDSPSSEESFRPPSSEKKSSRPPASEKESSHPDWLMLDGVLRSARGDDFRNGTVALQYTSTNDVIAVGVRAVAPPRISSLFFDWRPNPERPSKSRVTDPWPWLLNAKAVAAHGSSILLRIDTCSVNCHKICEEFFVYEASPVPSLTRLPACGHGTINVGITNNMGILSRDNGEFAVAHLTAIQKKGKGKCVDCPVTAHLCCLFDQDLASWLSTKDLPIRYPEGKAEDLFWWSTDTVVAFGHFICWVDYLRGILFCNVCSPNPELQYVPLPVNPYPSDEDPMIGGRGALSPYRNVCVTKDGCAIKFVDVACREFWFYGPACYCSSPSVITSWTLSSDRLTWIKDGDIKADEFSDLTKHLNLPETQLQFPLVHFKDPQTIYIVFIEHSDRKAFQITVKMASKEIDGPVCYSLRNLISSDENGSHSDTTCCNLDYHLPFIPFEFPKYKGRGDRGRAKNMLPDSSAFSRLQLNDAH